MPENSSYFDVCGFTDTRDHVDEVSIMSITTIMSFNPERLRNVKNGFIRSW